MLKSGEDSSILNPKSSWDSEERFLEKTKELAQKFIDNFKRYKDIDSDFDYSKAGPIL